MVSKRARKPDDRIKRGKDMLQAAWDMYKELDGPFPTVNDITKRLGLTKGTAYLYYSNKEEIFLEIYLSRMEQWTEGNLSALKKMKKDKLTANKIARIVTKYPLSNPAFLRLASSIKSVVEQNSNDEVVIQSRIRLSKLIDRTITELKEFFPEIPPKQIALTFIGIYALLIGLFQTITTSDEIQRRIKEENLKIFHEKFPSLVNEAVTNLLKGSLNL